MGRYSGEPFLDEALSTIGVDFKILTKETVIDDKKKKVKIQLWDTAGQERFKSITETYFRGSHGIILVFDVTNEMSYENIKQWYLSIRDHCTDGEEFTEKMIPLVLVGNKIDLKLKRMVSKEDGMEMAKKLGIKYYVETSAKSNENVMDAFEHMIKLTFEEKNFIEKRRDDDMDIIINPTQRDKKKNMFQKLCTFL